MSSVYELPGMVPIPRGHRIEITARSDAEQIAHPGEHQSVMSVVDLDTGIHYQWAGVHGAAVVVRHERVAHVTVTFASDGARTVLHADPVGTDEANTAAAFSRNDAGNPAEARGEHDRPGDSQPPRSQPLHPQPPRSREGLDPQEALEDADAAADAVRRESERWGGIDKPPQPEAPRFW